jgi:hypothetical protein
MRDCRAALAMTILLSSRGTWRARLSGAGGQTKERLLRRLASILSSRGTKRSRLSSASKQRKERLLRRLAMTRCVIARDVAISVVRGWRTKKREIASQARLYLSSRGTWRSRLFGAGEQRKERLPRCARNDNTPVIARDLAISVVRGWQTDKREIASQARNDRISIAGSQ